MSDAAARPDREPARPPDPLAVLVRALRGAGLEPTSDDLADALWLADQTGGRATAPDTPPPGPGGAAPGDRAAPPGAGTRAPSRATDAPEEARGDGPEQARPDPPDTSDTRPPAGNEAVALYAGTRPPGAPAGGDRGPRGALRVSIPEARSLPDTFELQRALRPLRRYRPAARPLRHTLDEARTAERSARAGGLLMPVFSPVTRREATVQLLMDVSTSTRVWQRLLGEFAELLAQLGAFRDVQVHYLHESPSGGPLVGSRFEPDAAPLRSARQLSDPTGRRLTVLLSDCVGPLWRSGQAHRLVHRLTRHAPVAILQPLPQRLWARTRLPVSFGTLAREEGPTPGGSRLRFRADGPAAGGAARSAAGASASGAGPGSPLAPGGAAGAVPVPVLPPVAGPLGAWARLLVGAGSGPVPAAVGWVRPDQPPAPPARARVEVSPAALVGRFRANASPGARQLAVYLAAAPLYLPVMQLVQRTMLPDSGPAELSEVLLSGLLRRRDAEPADGRWYGYAEGVHEELLAELGRDEALLVLKHCSGYVERRFGRGGPNFPALAVAQLTGEPPGVGTGAVESAPDGPGEGPRVPQPFAEVAAKVLRRFLPEAVPRGEPTDDGGRSATAVRRARALAERYDSDGLVQNLLDAVQVLRRATAQGRARKQATDPDLWSELAEHLLRLWRLQGDAALLREAQEAASTAAAHLGSARARTVLARVLHAAAGERRAGGDTRAAVELWRRADREFTAVCAMPGLQRRAALDLTLERVEVLAEQWRLGGDSGLLQESVGMLEAVADAWPVDEPQPSGLPLAHGRALLCLAGATADTERSRVHAVQAAESLEHARAALRAESASLDARIRAVLDLVDALLLAGVRLERAGQLLEQARELAGDRRLRAACLLRAGRLGVRRYQRDGAAAELVEAADLLAEASRLVPRDRLEHSELVEEWGAVLWERARLPGGAGRTSQAVQVLRNCRMETMAGDPRLSVRLLMLARALDLRYQQAGDLVDLREAEHLCAQAARGARDPLTRAWALFELGEAHRRAHHHARRPGQLDRAAETYRRAAEAASLAEAASPTGVPGLPGAEVAVSGDATPPGGLLLPVEPVRRVDAFRRSDAFWRGAPELREVAEPGGDPARGGVLGPAGLAGAAHHQRGVVYEAARRPRAAREAYQLALTQWRHVSAEDLAARTRERLTALGGEG